MENIKKYLDKITRELLDKENNKTELSEDSINWVTEITSPLYKLIDNIIIILADPISTPPTISNLYHILRKFLLIQPNIKDQLLDNELYPQTIVNYISLFDSEHKDTFTVDCFFVLVATFSERHFVPLLKEEFIHGIFESLSIVNDEECFDMLVELLVDISSTYVDIESNLFLKVYHYHDNARLINEVLLRQLNVDDNNKEKLFKLYLTMTNIMDKEKCCVLYSSDLEVFVDIALNKLDSTSSEELKFFILEAMERVTLYDEYYKDMYKIDEMNELFDNIANSDEISENIRERAQNILDNLAKHI